MLGAATQAAQKVGVRDFARILTARLRLEKPLAPSTVTRAIQRGTIRSVEPGPRGPLISVELAIAEYMTNTDPTLQLGASIRDGGGVAAAMGAAQPPAPAGADWGLSLASPSRPDAPSAPPPVIANPAVQQMHQDKAEQERIKRLTMQLDFAERQRRVAEVEPMKAAFSRQLVEVIQRIEVELPAAAQRIASTTGCDPHDALVELRGWFRAVRVDIAAGARARGEAMPDLVQPATAPESAAA